ncbi:BRO-N domain-containing protein [Oceanospirillum maris]|uniref:BRO-N domain-containing protein n=1 Tax=Oceanospirillum maris TaxID=64977 RepID=UPI0004140E0F|nr:Bro-N domain-containing protein [Oceanospirillum maris]
MAAQVIPFAFENREIRTLLIDDQPWFVASDIAKSLEYKTAKDMTRNLDADERGRHIMPTLSGNQEMTIINESGMYSAILRSRKPEAKRFKKWVTAEVLPSIRKHGFYGNAPKPQQVIGSEGMRCLSALIKGKTSHLKGRDQQSASTRLWNQLHTAFDVCSGMDIPEDQFNDARTFIASYTIEGEYLAAEKQPESLPVFKAKRTPSGFDKRHGLLSPEQMFDCGWRVDLLWAVKWLKEHEGQTVKLESGVTEQLALELNSLLHWYESYRNKLTDIHRMANMGPAR